MPLIGWFRGAAFTDLLILASQSEFISHWLCMINAVIYLDKETFKIQLVFGCASRKRPILNCASSIQTAKAVLKFTCQSLNLLGQNSNYDGSFCSPSGYSKSNYIFSFPFKCCDFYNFNNVFMLVKSIILYCTLCLRNSFFFMYNNKLWYA